MESKTDEDCYFYYYSTCLKGDACKFRHEPSAKGSETMCPLWLQDQCDKEHCNFRHSYIQKNRKEIPCYWENRPGGCKKPHCPYRHQCPRAAVEEEVDMDNECRESATNSANTEIPERKLGKLTSESSTPPSTELDTNLSDECKLVNVKKATPELQFWVEQKVQNLDSGNERKISILEDDIQVKIQSTSTQASNITTLNDVFTKQHSEFENRMKGNVENSESTKISGDDDLQKVSNNIDKCSTKFRRERSSSSAPETINRSLLHYDENDIKEDRKCLLDEDEKRAREGQVIVSEVKGSTHTNAQLETSGPSDMDYLDVLEEQEPLPSQRMRTIELDSSQDKDTLDMVRISVKNVDGKENSTHIADEETEEFVKPRKIKSVIGRPVINSKVDDMKYNSENNARCDFSSVRDCRESINNRRRGVALSRIRNKSREKRTEDKDSHIVCPNKPDNKEQKQYNTKLQIGVRNTKRSEKDCDTHLDSKTINTRADVNSNSSEQSTEIVNNVDAIRKSENLANVGECNSRPSENSKDIDLNLKVCTDLKKVSSKKRLLSQVVPANTRSVKTKGERSDSPNSDTDDSYKEPMSTKLDTAPAIEPTYVKNKGEIELSSKIRSINQSSIEDCSKPKRLKLKRESIYQHFSSLSTKSTNHDQLKEADTSPRDRTIPTVKSSKVLSENNTSDEDSMDSSGEHCTEINVPLHGHVRKTSSTSAKEGTASEEGRNSMQKSPHTKTRNLDATVKAEDPHQDSKMPSLSQDTKRIASSQFQLPASLDIDQNISGGHSKSSMYEKGLLMDYEDSTVTLDVDEDIIRDIDAFLEDN